jgi:hypothetical protein
LLLSLVVPKLVAKEILAKDLLPYLEDAPPSVQVEVEFCNKFKVVEKPYYVIWISCWVCAVCQQIIDATRHFEEKTDELGNGQKFYVCCQLVTLVGETFSLFVQIDWFDGASLWSMYNLYVYVFVHSAVFVRSVMMSMIVWDWYEAKLLKRPVISKDWDGKGWSDSERALLLVVILQFGSSAFVMAIVVATHLLPALFIYYWVFLFTAAFVIKLRQWLTVIGIDPESRFGRGLVMASNSFAAIVGNQMLITAMIRVFAGQWSAHGYMTPIEDDLDSRHYDTYYACHLSKGWGAFNDQDFMNLFIR